MVAALSDRVVAMTGPVASIFPDWAQGRIVQIADGIDISVFNPAVSGKRIRSELGIGVEERLVGFVSRLDPWKGADVFISIAARVAVDVPDVRFLVCAGELPGYEEYASDLERQAKSLGIGDRVIFTGWRYRLDDIPEVMAAIDILVHTSVRPEPFGLVLIEAMASGKPVIAASDGGVPEVVEDGVTGFLADPREISSYVQRLKDLLNNRPLARQVGIAARRRVEGNFEMGNYVRRIERLYDEVLIGRGQSD
jgi:glycosyltransferase involved in cell wall biosynthesis